MARPGSDQARMAEVLDVMEVAGALKGKAFSITGHLGKPRPEIVKIIEDAGGRFDERPKWGRNHFLVTNRDWNKGSTIQPKKSSKLLEAERQGTKIITEDELYQMIIDNDPSTKNLAG